MTSDLPHDFVVAHGHVLADKALQFSFSPPPSPVKPPEWLKYLKPVARVIDWIVTKLGPFGSYIFWAIIALVLGAVLLFILRELGYVEWFRRKPVAAEDEEAWGLESAPAQKLLAEADALAAAGRFDEAAHLLLLRSFEDIANRRAHLLKPATTAREMAENEGLPTAARDMFAQITRHVEASLFGGNRLDAEGWGNCRAAYTRFALPGDWL